MPRLIVREFEISDYDAVRGLWLKGKPGIGQIDTLEQVRKKVERDPELFLVAEDDGTVVGSVLGAWDGRRGWVYHLAVLPGKRRSGVATVLLKEVEERMRKKGVFKVNAIIYQHNEPSLAFFKKMGYARDDALLLQGKILSDE